MAALFTALNVPTRQVSSGKDVHVILDNCATRKHPKVCEWLTRHLRWTFHFTPTPSPWLNAMEGVPAKCLASASGAGSLFSRRTDGCNPRAPCHAEPPFQTVQVDGNHTAAVKRGHQVLEEQKLCVQMDFSAPNCR